MALYEHVFISRQDLSTSQAEALIEEFSQILKDNGGKVVDHEYWGLKTMAYKINKNRKGHYAFIKSDCLPEAAKEMERLMRLNEDVMRVMTIRVKNHEEGPSIIVKTRNKNDEKSSTRQRYDSDAGYTAH